MSSTFRSPGILNVPSVAMIDPAGASWGATDSGLPNGSKAPMPMSSVVSRTPMLRAPVSLNWGGFPESAAPRRP